MIIVLIGPPGSGKGTQGHFLANELNLPHLSIGDIFRKMAKDDSEDGRRLNEYMKDGKLAPSDLVNSVVGKVLQQPQYTKGCLLDGYPRTIEQAKFLEKFTEQKIIVIFLEIEDKVAVERILNRFSCANCSTIYNSNINNFKNPCKICGSLDFISRKDDNIEIIDTRIKVYKQETYPLNKYYANKNNIYFINANNEAKQVGEELLSLLKKI